MNLKGKPIVSDSIKRSSPQRPGYGIDAPGLVRTFFIVAVVAAGLAIVAARSPWPGRPVATIVSSLAGLVAAYGLGMGCYMLYGSLIEKVRGRDQLLDLIPWAADEAVLDVGCGRGLLLVAAAKRVPSGRAVGVDVWQAADQSGNRPEATLANAASEGVAERVEVQTGDARRLPFADRSFDAVVSHWVIHNVPSPAGRAHALTEMSRVLRPGGWVLIADIGLHAEYVARLRELGFAEVRYVVSPFWDKVRAAVTFGTFRPGAVIGRWPIDVAQERAKPSSG